jgi:hypothetical protein
MISYEGTGALRGLFRRLAEECSYPFLLSLNPYLLKGGVRFLDLSTIVAWSVSWINSSRECKDKQP